MKLIHILHVEDCEGDIILIRDAIEEVGIAHTVDTVRDGNEAIQFLNRVNEYKDKEMPDLVLLDINMPNMNGYELLDYIKGDGRFKHLPVIMLSTSSSETDILKSYQKYSSCYIIKPNSSMELDKVVRDIGNFWSSIPELPYHSVN